MFSKFIKLVVLLSLLVCCGFAGRVLYSYLVVQGKDPRHIFAFDHSYRPSLAPGGGKMRDPGNEVDFSTNSIVALGHAPP